MYHILQAVAVGASACLPDTSHPATFTEVLPSAVQESDPSCWPLGKNHPRTLIRQPPLVLRILATIRHLSRILNFSPQSQKPSASIRGIYCQAAALRPVRPKAPDPGSASRSRPANGAVCAKNGLSKMIVGHVSCDLS